MNTVLLTSILITVTYNKKIIEIFPLPESQKCTCNDAYVAYLNSGVDVLNFTTWCGGPSTTVTIQQTGEWSHIPPT